MKAAVIYWTSSGNTEGMANYIADGMKDAGAEVEVFDIASAPTDLSGYDKVAFGCPAMGAEELDDTEFEPYFAGIEGQLNKKPIALFGSYGWGEGEWMRTWIERANSDGADVFGEGLIARGEGDETECKAFGNDFAK